MNTAAEANRGSNRRDATTRCRTDGGDRVKVLGGGGTLIGGGGHHVHSSIRILLSDLTPSYLQRNPTKSRIVSAMFKDSALPRLATTTAQHSNGLLADGEDRRRDEGAPGTSHTTQVWAQHQPEGPND